MSLYADDDFLLTIAHQARVAYGTQRLNACSEALQQRQTLATLGIDAADDEWQRRFRRLCKLLRIDRNVRLLQSTFLKTPIAVGLIKPLIIVPASVFLQMDPRQLECIIAHELIHIRRYDCLINILQSVVEIAFFYHPAVWWISKARCWALNVTATSPER